MEIANQVVWWIGLIGALLITLVILKEVSLVLQTLGDIHKLAEFTRDAARGISANLTPVTEFSDQPDPSPQLIEITGDLVEIVSYIEQRLGDLTAGISRRGG